MVGSIVPMDRYLGGGVAIGDDVPLPLGCEVGLPIESIMSLRGTKDSFLEGELEAGGFVELGVDLGFGGFFLGLRGGFFGGVGLFEDAPFGLF